MRLNMVISEIFTENVTNLLPTTHTKKGKNVPQKSCNFLFSFTEKIKMYVVVSVHVLHLQYRFVFYCHIYFFFHWKQYST